MATLPQESRAASTMTDGRVQVSASWNVAVPVHPEVELTVKDMKEVTLGFQARPNRFNSDMTPAAAKNPIPVQELTLQGVFKVLIRRGPN